MKKYFVRTYIFLKMHLIRLLLYMAALSTDCPQPCLKLSTSDTAAEATFGSESQNMLFPSILHGDTLYDPPLLESPCDSTGTSESISDGE